MSACRPTTSAEIPPPNPLLGYVACECGGSHDFRDHPEDTPMPTSAARPVVTNDDANVALCTLAGDATAEHDYRPYTYQRFNKPHTSWRCVWCHTVACGDYGEADPCWMPYHHREPHRTRSGVTWSIGGTRP